MRIRREGLDAENSRALTIYSRCATRFCADTHSGGVVLAKLTGDDDDEAFGELMDRLHILYDVLNPPPVVKSDGA